MTIVCPISIDDKSRVAALEFHSEIRGLFPSRWRPALTHNAVYWASWPSYLQEPRKYLLKHIIWSWVEVLQAMWSQNNFHRILKSMSHFLKRGQTVKVTTMSTVSHNYGAQALNHEWPC